MYLAQRTPLDSSSFCVQGKYLNSQPETHGAETASREESSQTKDSSEQMPNFRFLATEIIQGIKDNFPYYN